MLVQKSTELKLEGENVLRKIKRVVQSHGQAYMNSVHFQSCHIGQGVYYVMIELLPQRCVVSHVVYYL